MPLPKVSGIDRVAYDPNTRVLQVWLKGSVGPYKFAKVPQDVYDDLRQAASVEAYFESSIRTVTASVEGRTMGLRLETGDLEQAFQEDQSVADGPRRSRARAVDGSDPTLLSHAQAAANLV